MTDSTKPAPEVEVLPAAAGQAFILDNLFQLYAHDFSEFHDVEIGANGRFVYKNLPLYWSEPGRHPFLIWLDGTLAGFALVKQGSEISGVESVWDMAEFFVLRAYRKRGIGTRVAHEVWNRFPGAWEVRVLQANVLAQQFWAGAIAEFTRESTHPVGFAKDGERWTVFSFDSNSRSAAS
jgi:predicted acetyltransferase